MNTQSVKSRGYEIKEQIGAGGFGVVYRAAQPSVGRDVAIKVVLPEIARDPLFIQRFEQEAKLAAQLEHANIVPLYDYWQDDERAYLVMRWLQGGSLRDLLKQGPLDSETAVRLVTQIASALEAAHEQGIVHRDLKPSNVLLDEKGNAYLSDFGIAKHLVGTTIGTPTGAIIGSPAYMAPEQITGGEVTAQSDLYSLGVMLFEMVTGETPFGDVEPVAMLYSQVNQPVPLACERNPSLPGDVDRVIQQATNKQPAGRYPDAVSLSLAFNEALLSGEPVLVANEEEIPLHNLPSQSTLFIGREDEVEALGKYLDEPHTRLLTVIGPGGMGKTRLALATAETQVGRFEHGVFFVSLAPVEAAEDVATAVGRAIDFTFPGGANPSEELANFLRRRSMLLVLDNFEHLLEAAPLVAEIVRAAPSVQIIVTTRQRLDLQDEQLYPLHGLSFPSWETPEDAAGYAAVQLFMQSARRVRPDFELVQGDLGPLTRICRLSQGMPLAILLAAGWIELLSPAEIAEELGHSLDILETGMRDLPARQRSMRAVFDYTWNHLNRKEQELLKNLSVFRGGCSIRAAREITGASLPVLRTLVDKSLLQGKTDDRYELHELLRQFAAEKLADDPDADTGIRDTHCDYYLTALAEREEALFSDRFLETMADIDIDLENVRAAWSWAVENRQVKLLERAFNCLFSYHHWQKNVQFLFEDAQLVVDRYSNSEIPEERRAMAWALLYQGRELTDREDRPFLERALTVLREPDLEHLDNRTAMAFCLERLGEIATRFDTNRSRKLLSESLSLYETVGDQRGVAKVKLDMAYLAHNDGDFLEAERLARTSLEIMDELGNPLQRFDSLRGVASSLRAQGRFDEAMAISQQLKETIRGMGTRYTIHGSFHIAALHRTLGLYKEAYRQFGELIVYCDKIGDSNLELTSSFWRAWVGLHLGRYQQFISITSEYKARLASRLYLGYQSLGCGAALLALGQIDDARKESIKASETFRLGGLRPQSSRSLAVLTLVIRAVGDMDSARKQLSESIQLAIEMRSPPVLYYGLLPSALLLADGGDKEQAVAVYTLALQNPIVANSRWFYDVAGKEIEAIANSLPPAEAEAARARGAELDIWTTAEELLNEFQTTPHTD